MLDDNPAAHTYPNLVFLLKQGEKISESLLDSAVPTTATQRDV